MDQQYSLFERERLIRKAEHLITPPISFEQLMLLPRNSLLHYIAESKVDIGPPSDYPLFRNVSKPIQIHALTELVDPPNNPRRITFDVNPIIRGYFLRYRRFRKLIDVKKMPTDEKTLIVENYCLIHNSYKYIRSLFSDYNEWQDLMYTVTHQMNEIANVSQRNQFIMMDVPEILPAVSRLQKAVRGIDQQGLVTFRTPSSRFLLELWKWLNEEKVPNIFDRIEVKNYRYINILIRDSGRWTGVTLEKLWYWVKENNEQYKQEIKDKNIPKIEQLKIGSTSYTHLQMQKYLLRLLMTLSAGRSSTGMDADSQLEEALKGNDVKKEQDQVDPDDLLGQNDPSLQPDPSLNEDLTPELIPPVTEDPKSKPSSKKVKSSETVAIKKSVETPDGVAATGKGHNDSRRKLTELVPTGLASEEESNAVITDEVNALIDADLAQLEEINAVDESVEVLNPNTGEVLPLASDDTRPYETRLRDRIAQMAETGQLTASEYRRFNTLAEKYKTLPDPYTGSGNMVEAIEVKPEEVQVDVKHVVAPNATVLDETMLYSSLDQAQAKYINTTLKKHILQCILHVQNADIILDNIRVDRTENIQGVNRDFEVRLIPLEGTPGTLRFPIPEITPDGCYVANGVKYSMRSQRGDEVVRKVAFNKVSLTSYFGKFFIHRGRKATNSYGKALVDQVMSMGNDPSIKSIIDVKTANVFNMSIPAPRSITSLATQIREFTVVAEKGEEFVFHLDLSKIKENFSQEGVAVQIKKGFTPIAKSNRGRVMYYEGDSFYLIEGEKIVPVGELEDILGIKVSDTPVEFVELKIAGKFVPIGLILAHDYGLSELIRRLKIKTRRVPRGTRTKETDDEVAIVFSDETLLYSRSDKMASLLLGGFNEFKNIIRGFSITDFDRRAVYQNVLDSTGGGTRILREIKLAKSMFVDPISRQVLTMLNQPTDFMGLLVYATELLMDDLHRPELDMSEMRIKGYERIAGTIYQELVQAVRAHEARPGKSRYPIEMKPFAIWQSLAKDPSIVVVKDINPMEDMKRREEVTFAGAGGRSKDTMVASTRAMGETDKGIISEATKDSGDVGINVYMPPNPQFANTLGMPIKHADKNFDMSSLMSSSVLASPAAARDDAKRRGFISIQHAHGIAVAGQQENIVGTGYENVIAHRCSELFSVTAKQKGVVTAVSDDVVSVKYEDGTVGNYPIGRQYGENAGMTIPHMLVTPLTVGKKFIEGDAITYNEGFFRPSTLNPRQVTWCNGTYGHFALLETSDTIEDASVISRELADLLMAQQTKMRTIVVSSKQSIAKMVKVGDAVSYDDILCIIQDEITSGMDMYDEADIDTLKALGSQAPKAKYDGVVERIEVFYRADKEDMSESIRKLANASDREIASKRKALNKQVVTGEVNEGFKIKGNSIPLDSVAIRLYITGPEPAGVGDKIVLANQLKSIVGKVLKEPMKAKDGTKIFGRFSYTSIARRIVNSPDIIGTTTAVLMRGSELTVQAYDS